MSNRTPDELKDLLTDEEREGLEDLEGEGTEAAAEEVEQEAAPAGEPPAAEEKEEEEAPQSDPTPPPQPDDSAEKLEALRTKEDELAEQFDNGDLTATEYRAQVRALDVERREIERAQTVAQVHHDFEMREWHKSVKTFLDAHPELTRNQIVMGAYDSIVREVTADPKNASLSNEQQLDMAYKRWSEALDFKPTAQKSDKPTAKAKPEIPPTLSRVPAAVIEDTESGKYGHLDRLMDTDPIAFETALARMPEAERNAYLESR